MSGEKKKKTELLLNRIHFGGGKIMPFYRHNIHFGFSPHKKLFLFTVIHKHLKTEITTSHKSLADVLSQ